MAQDHKQKGKLVSVIVPCFNYGKYLQRAVESIEVQTFSNIEIIIINDGSSDDTDLVAQKLLKKNPSIQYVKQQNKGIVAVRNLGLGIAKGEFVLQLDADDYLEKNYIQATVEVAIKKKADIVYTDYVMFGAQEGKSDFPNFDLEILKNQNFINVSCLLRKSAVDGLLFDETLSGMTHEDWDFFLNACINGAKAVKCSSTHLNYFIHEAARNNTMGTFDEKRKYIDVYSYVIDKQTKTHPKKFDYLASRTFAHWYASLDDERKASQLTGEKYLHKIRALEKQNKVLSENIQGIIHSRKYRLAQFLSLGLHPNVAATSLRRRTRTLIRNAKISRLNRSDIAHAVKLYKANDKKINSIRPSERVGIAVVLHLYYADMWPLFVDFLSKLQDYKFDLYVSVPEGKEDFEGEIKKEFPNSFVYVTPNRGRDVLPFIWLAPYIQKLGYKFVLKIHSKKSKHRDDGSVWLGDILKSLIPSNKEVLNQLMVTLRRSDTAVVGPQAQYTSSAVNFEANKSYITKILDDTGLKGCEAAVHEGEYGFFAGTMFWAQCSQLDSIIDKGYGVSDFDLEQGQIDGTFAHGLERAFCVVPELQGCRLFEVGEKGVEEVIYDQGVIPEWSDLYDKEKL